MVNNVQTFIIMSLRLETESFKEPYLTLQYSTLYELPTLHSNFQNHPKAAKEQYIVNQVMMKFPKNPLNILEKMSSIF